jgi:ribosomal protein S18 acetylase RimI-like enzyme
MKIVNNKIALINMLKTDMDNVIDSPLPNGYSFRLYKKGDRELWVDLYNRLDEHSEVTTKEFDESFGADHALLSKNMFFLCEGSKEIGTITAWPEDDIGGVKTLRLHWAGVDKDHRGLHLGSALMSFILKHMREQGCKACVLGTGEKRIEALNLYLKFGFLPVIYTDKYSPLEDQKESWLRVKQLIAEKHKDKITF